MNKMDQFHQYLDVSNSIGPISNEVKELFCFVSRGPDGLEGLMSISLTDMPVNMQAVTSNKDSIRALREAVKQIPVPPGVTIHLCRFVLDEEIEQL